MASSLDPVAASKVVSKFAKSNDAFKIRIGAMNGDLIDEQTIMKLAALPGRDELLAKLAATFRAPLDAFARTLSEVPSKFVRTLVAVRDQHESA
jgi:large subunit ribosomal protein L10